MMQTNYQVAFGIDVLHTYFEQDICPCLQFTPGAGSAKLMRRFEITLLKKVNGFDLYIDSPQTVATYLNYISKATGQNYFDFDIVNTNPQFYLFTQTGKLPLGQLAFNSKAGTNTYQDGVLQLGPGQAPNSNMAAIGSLLLYFDDIIRYGKDKVQAMFNISFEARATQWQYFIINRSAVKLDNPVITGKGEIGFEGPENVTIQSGQQAMLFSSGTNLIPLSETPVYKFDLVNKPTGSPPGKKTTAGKVIFKGLPNPHPGTIAPAGNNLSDQLASPMYVYV